MSVIRLGRALFRSVFKHLPELKGSGNVSAKSGQCSHELKQDGNSAARLQVVLSSRAPQNLKRVEKASVLARGVWKGFTCRAGFLGNSQAALLRRRAAERLLRSCGSKAPVFAFLGFAYANNNVDPPKDVAEREQFDKLHQWIQNALCTTQREQQEEVEEEPSHAGLKLQDYEIGERLGESSSNSAVYAASHMGKEYAVKMLFNFGAESQSVSLYKEFAKECQVLSADRQAVTVESGPSYTSLPQHPNISPLLHTFAGNVPCLPDAIHSYPAALPSRHGDGSFSRNRTLFLVMPRYSRTVQQYLRQPDREPDPGVSTLLLLQLLEGITHLTRHSVAHRDLKTDNLLLDDSPEGVCPRLVIADFGCCLADRRWGLRLPFISDEMDRGGNALLMAPEIATAIPGEGAVLDYNKSDAWAAGAIAYELFGEMNPFSREGLDNRTYSDHQLSSVMRASEGVRKVVYLLLKRDPSERISADTAATMLHLTLWAPPRWLRDVHVTANDVIRWLIGRSVQVFFRRTTRSVEDEVLRRFLCCTSVEEIMEALDQFKDDAE